MIDGTETQGELLPAETDSGAPAPAESIDCDFSWRDTESVIIEQQPKTACYWNPVGQVVVRQDGWPDDDAYLIFNLEHLPTLISALQQMLKK